MTMQSTTKSATLAMLASAISLAAATARAQSLDYGAFEALFGEPVTASVTGSPQRSQDVPAAMRVITADEIRRSGARDLPGILRHVAGVDVLETSNDHSDLSVRGYNTPFSSRLLVLIDGRQVYADYYGFTPWSTLPIELDAIRQIEVVKGPNSALFGFNAVGGVVNIVTYDPLRDSVNAAGFAAGTQNTMEGSLVSTFDLRDNAKLRLTAGGRSGDDFSTPLSPADVGTRRGDERDAINLRGAVQIRENIQFDIEATRSDVDHSEFSPVNTLTYGHYEASSFKARAAAETSLGLIEGTVYRNDLAADVYMGAEQTPFFALDNDVLVAQVQSISKLGSAHTLRLSAEFRDDTMNTAPIEGGRVHYRVAALAAMWEWKISSKLVLTAAARTDRLRLGRDGDVPPGYGLTNDDWDRTITEPSLNAGLVWDVTGTDRLRFLAARGVQLPNLFNLGGFVYAVPFAGYFGGVPSVDPTVVTNYELVWDRRLPGLDARLSTSLFRGHTHGIVAQGGGPPVGGLIGTPANIGQSHTRGVEVSVDGKLAEHWRWGASYLGQAVEDDFGPAFTVETAFVDYEDTAPRHVLKGNLGWSRGPWEVDGYLRYQSTFYGIESPDGVNGINRLARIPAYTALDARLGYALNERVTLGLSGQNLTRATQRQTAAPEVERELLATFEYRF